MSNNNYKSRENGKGTENMRGYDNKNKEYHSTDRNSDSRNLPQYGKKGHKPRVSGERSAMTLDDIRTNDISYWNKSQGFDNVTKFNWDLIVGRPRNANSVIYETNPNFTGDLNPTQLMVVQFIMGCGYAASVEDGVNRGLSKIMATIRANLSTSNIGFETADLGIFLTSTASIAAFIGYAKRILECYTVWQDRNYVYPRALIRAQGPLYSDIRDNINVYAAKLNAIIDQYNAMNILDTFDVFDRQYSMCHNVFVDEDSQFGQLYMFMPDNYYIYDDTATPSKAKFTGYSASGKTFSQILAIIQGMIDAWYSSSDLYQINGTLLRAFKDAPRQNIPYYNITDRITPVVDRAFLMQIMNATLVGNSIDYTTCDITQDATSQNYVKWMPMMDSSFFNPEHQTQCADYQMLRVFENDLNNDDNMEMTRLLNFTDPIDLSMTHCGSELVTQVVVYSYNTVTDALVPAGIYGSNVIYVDVTAPTSLTVRVALESVGSICPFRYIPTLHIMMHNNTTDAKQYFGLMGDIYNWMLYAREDWNTLQFVSSQSLWTPKNL